MNDITVPLKHCTQQRRFVTFEKVLCPARIRVRMHTNNKLASLFCCLFHDLCYRTAATADGFSYSLLIF